MRRILFLALALSQSGCALTNPRGFDISANVGMHAVDEYHQESRMYRKPMPYICAFWNIPGKCDLPDAVAAKGTEDSAS